MKWNRFPLQPAGSSFNWIKRVQVSLQDRFFLRKFPISEKAELLRVICRWNGQNRRECKDKSVWHIAKSLHVALSPKG